MKFLGKINKLKAIQAIKNSLKLLIPILLIGSLSLVVISFPINAYQDFIKTFLNGLLYDIFNVIYQVCFGGMSIVMVYSISTSYYAVVDKKVEGKHGVIFSSMVAFLILSGVFSESFNISAFGARGMFSAIVSSITASYLYLLIKSKLKIKIKLYTDGSDGDLNNSMSILVPFLLVTLIFAVINYAICAIFDVSCFYELIVKAFTNIFENMPRNYFGGLVFILISSILWIFGIHGSNILEIAADNFLVPGLGVDILSKSFIDVFALMGGCGSTICLLIAILLFSKKDTTKNLAHVASVPAIFNINELFVFGLPIIYNITLIVPFILCPLVNYSIAYFATYIGILPKVVNLVEWTTPVIFGGYYATNSIVGSIIQVVNIIIGVLIYAPFVKLYDRQKDESVKQNLEELIKQATIKETNNTSEKIIDQSNSVGALARVISFDLRNTIKNKKITLYYHPQFDENRVCIGAEALLRYKHPQLGDIYPPLAVMIASENGYGYELDEAVLLKAVEDIKEMNELGFVDYKISINVEVDSLVDERYLEKLNKIKDEINPNNIYLEITERRVLSNSIDTTKVIETVRNMGYRLAIDDFSAGATSFQYLKSNNFSLVKIDGNLVESIETNSRSLEIISSLISLSQNLDFKCIAEYVSSKQLFDKLKQIGCDYYQGFYLSQPLKKEDFFDLLNNNRNIEK
ncbi:MAG: PTS sugar transporter subunit IIC/EAL domain-containing protein [Bacilli bacterium]